MSLYDKSSLVLIPSGTKTGKVYSQKPVSGDGDFTFTRSSAATRVNADGNIEKEKSNLLTHSNTFSSWTPANATTTSGQSGYDGTNDAWLLAKAASAGNIQLNVSSSGVNTFSYYAKAGSVDWTRLLILGSTNASTYINLTNGAIGIGGGGFIDATATDVGSGWWRVSITHSTAITQVRIYPAPADNDTSGSSGNIYIQDAQLNQGLIAQEVITTTTTAVEGGITDNVPRLDYTDSSCPALLLEPQRTNLIVNSEYFSASGVWLPNTITITDNYGTSPEGLDNSTRLVLGNLTASRIAYAPTLTNGTTYTFSCYYKGTAGEKLYMEGNGSGGSGTQTSKLITLTGEWQREDLQFVGGSSSNLIYIVDSRNGTEDTALDFEVYGAQLEAGSYPTSYIPTYGSSVTRVGETCLDSSATDVIGQTEGTLFFECTNKALVANARYFSLSDGTGNNRIDIYHHTSDRIGIYVATSGAAQVNVTNVDLPASGSFKFALGYANNDYVWYVNGTQVGTDTSASVPSCSHTLLGTSSDGSVAAGNNPFKQALLFKTRLSNQELAALTTI